MSKPEDLVVPSKGATAGGGMTETVRTLAYALLIAMAIRTLAFEPFSVPSESMMPTLLVGDYFFVSKYPYGYSKNSMPFSPPLFSGRILGREPARGDVIVFRRGQGDKTDFVKRLIGLPGDRIQMKEGALYINDVAVPRQVVPEPFLDSRGDKYVVYRETLPNGVTYLTLDRQTTAQDNTSVYTVEAGHYFMMGDNRDNSHDSRFSDFGHPSAEGLEGRAEILFFSSDGSASWWEFWKWPWAVRYNRILNGLRG